MWSQESMKYGNTLLYTESEAGMWIQTRTGREYRLDGTFSAADVSLEDIAHALSMTCRYNGHCKLFYSVAEHSVHVMRRVRQLVAGAHAETADNMIRAALMHDAAEAYVGDIPTPIKTFLGPVFKALENDTMEAIEERFNLIPTHQHLIKQADLECLAAEAMQLFDPPPLPEWAGRLPEPWEGCRVQGWPPPMARQRFLWAAEGLGIHD
jgi:hypothetical protein